jgi:FixJ family two-component response regulator
MMAAHSLVAVVDDEESVRRALSRMLGASQFDVVSFASAQEFLDSLSKQRRPDCVVLDLQMPGLSGRDMLRRMGTAGVKIPVIVVTAHDQPELRDQCMADGAVAYLEKPLQREKLVGLIRDVM